MHVHVTDRKSTRLNSSHVRISYAVFCLNHPATTDIYTLSLHDALPISVNFISEETLKEEHSLMPHGGFVIRSGTSSEGINQVVEYSLQLQSNPEFTASVLVAYARACHRLSEQGQYGCKTVFDVAPGLLSPKSAAQLRKELL